MTNKEFLRWVEEQNPTLSETMQKFEDGELDKYQCLVINSNGIYLRRDEAYSPLLRIGVDK